MATSPMRVATGRLGCWLIASLWLGVGALPANAYLGARAASIAEALFETESAVIAEVLETTGDGTSASLRVLHALKGGIAVGETQVRAEPGADRRPDFACRFESGETVFVLLSSGPGGGNRCTPGFRISKLTLAAGPEAIDAAAALVRGYLASANADGLRPSATFLESQLTIDQTELRAGVLFDLSAHIGAEDLPLLTRLSADPTQFDDVRVWAVRQVARVAPDEYPAELAALLDPPSSPQLRQATLQAYGARRATEDLPLMRKGLQDTDPAVRRMAVESLYIPESVGMLATQYDRDPSLEVRVAIVRQLGHVGSGDAATALRAIAVNAPEPSVREAARLALASAEP